jgi:hypothetical protein
MVFLVDSGFAQQTDVARAFDRSVRTVRRYQKRLCGRPPVGKGFLSSSGEASKRMLEQGDCARIMRSCMVQHPAKRRRALLGSNPPRNSRCKLNVMGTGRCA